MSKVIFVPKATIFYIYNVSPFDPAKRGTQGDIGVQGDLRVQRCHGELVEPSE